MRAALLWTGVGGLKAFVLAACIWRRSPNPRDINCSTAFDMRGLLSFTSIQPADKPMTKSFLLGVSNGEFLIACLVFNFVSIFMKKLNFLISRQILSTVQASKEDSDPSNSKRTSWKSSWLLPFLIFFRYHRRRLARLNLVENVYMNKRLSPIVLRLLLFRGLKAPPAKKEKKNFQTMEIDSEAFSCSFSCTEWKFGDSSGAWRAQRNRTHRTKILWPENAFYDWKICCLTSPQRISYPPTERVL